jgi:hypothetical protein
MSTLANSTIQRNDPFMTGRPPFAGDDAIMAAFIRNGGLRTDDEVQDMLGRRTSQPLSVLAKWIVQRHIVSLMRAGRRGGGWESPR